jgi:hypothetical protein
MLLLEAFEGRHFSEFALCSGCTLSLLPPCQFQRTSLDNQVRYLVNLSEDRKELCWSALAALGRMDIK